MNNNLYLRRSNKVVITGADGETPANIIAAFIRNIETIGYVCSNELIQELLHMNVIDATSNMEDLIEITRSLSGSRMYQPYFPNFPIDVMAVNRATEFIKDVTGYISENAKGITLPTTLPAARAIFDEQYSLQMIHIGNTSEYNTIFNNIYSSNSAPSEQDKEDLSYFIRVENLIVDPDLVQNKEMMAVIFKAMLDNNNTAGFIMAKTPTDLLRMAQAMITDGDVSLKVWTHSNSPFPRSIRKLFLSRLNNMTHNVSEDMYRHRTKWIRFAEALHPGDYADKFNVAYTYISHIRNNKKPFVQSFNSKIEEYFKHRSFVKLDDLLSTRPGEYIRRLTRILETFPDNTNDILNTLLKVLPETNIATRVSLRDHLFEYNRERQSNIAMYMPKGGTANIWFKERKQRDIPNIVLHVVVNLIRITLESDFNQRDPLGNCYIDPELTNYKVPMGLRSSSSGVRIVPRFSRLTMTDKNFIRLFIWWKNSPTETIDLDLSITLLNDNFEHIGIINYTDEKNESCGLYHSGDITSAPNGAAEYIDIDKDKALAGGVCYMAMSVHSYTSLPFKEVPEATFGWMERNNVVSGEVFEARTVKNRIAITSNSTFSLPGIYDLRNNQVIWVDGTQSMSEGRTHHVNNMIADMSNYVSAIVDLDKPNLYDLFSMHIRARGNMVETPEEADTIFSLTGNVTPFNTEVILSDYL